MEEPSPELKADADKRKSVPDFDALTDPKDLVRGERTRDDFFDAVLGLDSPATVGDVADLAGHGVDAAREYLDWFERMGIVTRVTESPATYERNDEYLRWRRVQRLRKQYTTDELLSHLDGAGARRGLRRDVRRRLPECGIDHGTRNGDRSVEAVWEDVSAWKTTRRRIALLEQALTSGVDESGEERIAA